MIPQPHGPTSLSECWGKGQAGAAERANLEHGSRKSDSIISRWNIYNENIPLARGFRSLRKPKA